MRTFFDHFQMIILAVVCGVVTSKKSPRSQRCIKVDSATLERRHHQIPADQGERGGVAEFHGAVLWTTGDAGVSAIAGAIRLVRVRVIVNWTTSKPSAS